MKNKIKLMQGDCLKLLPSIPSKSIDMIFADLPYGKINAKWDNIIPMKQLFEQYQRVIKDNGIILLFGMGLFSDKLELTGNQYVPYRYEWIWHKAPKLPFMCHKRPMSAVEKLSVFYKHLPTYNPQMWKGEPWIKGVTHQIGRERKYENAHDLYNFPKVPKLVHNNGWHYPINIIRDNGSNNQYTKSYHPTQKPLKLIEYFIKTYTNKGDLVLDNTMGSGTTGVACKRLHRHFIGMEINQYYFKVAKKRIQNAK